MKKLLAAAVLTAGVSIVHAATMPVGNAANGKVKADTVCVACHGVGGDSAMTGIPRLAGQNAKYIYKQLNDFKSGARAGTAMPGIAATLSEQDMADAGAFFATQKGKVTSADPETVDAGRKLFFGGDATRGVIPCAGCHGGKGAGNAGAAYPKIGGQRPEYIKAQLQAFRAAGREDEGAMNTRVNDSPKKDAKGPMQQVAAKLSDKDINALSNFIGALH